MNKYRAKKVSLDGHTFASKAEARRYAELRLLYKSGEISAPALQIRYPLMVGDILIGRYVADFVYRWRKNRNNYVVVEDVKGFRTQLYKWKKKHFEAQYGIKITEVRA